MTLLTRLRTLAALGPANVARVASYRLRLRAGVHAAQRINAELPVGPFFRATDRKLDVPAANHTWDDRLNWFGWYSAPLPDGPPDWFHNPFGPRGEAEGPWWQIGDFAAGDIKGVWELSRFDWAVAYATEIANGDRQALDRLNLWLQDWSARNPPYRGVNWKCGQEASIRVMHLALAAMLLDQDASPERGLIDLIAAHLRRIRPTMSYAIGQQNNHGTSEAAALFIGGTLLGGLGDARGTVWAKAGRRGLEERAGALIAPDGSFSQYSLNYHRLMLDTYCLAESWRRRRGLPEFSGTLRSRLAAAAHWLRSFVDLQEGQVPNIGANDGAHLLPLTAAAQTDFRPSAQLACVLFLDARAIAEAGPWDWPLAWLGIPSSRECLPSPGSESFDDGGFHLLRAGAAMACLRYPRFRFRPSQADALHLDLWVGGRNLLRDAGTFSYNAPDGSERFFAGTAAHNTIQFDDRDQMPRLGRFLFASWLTPEQVELVAPEQGAMTAGAGYRDADGARHHRRVRLEPEGFTCIDRVSGAFGKAVLRWRLQPGRYRLEDNRLIGEHLELAINSQDRFVRLVMSSAPESRHYLQRSDIPVLEVELDGACTIVTEGRF